MDGVVQVGLGVLIILVLAGSLPVHASVWGDLKRDAEALEGEDSVGTVYNIRNYVRDSMEYEVFWTPRPLYKTWGEKRGDCTDVSKVVKYMLNSRGIRAVPVHGWYVNESGDWIKHDWLEVTVTFDLDPYSNDLSSNVRRGYGWW